MFDESYCAGMSLGPAQVGIGGLNELAAVLKLLFPNQALGARSRPLKKERGRAKEKEMLHFDAIPIGSETSPSRGVADAESQGPDSGTCRSSARSRRRRKREGEGR